MPSRLHPFVVALAAVLLVSGIAEAAKPKSKPKEVKFTSRDDAEANLEKSTKSSDFSARAMAYEGLAFVRDRAKAMQILKDGAKDPQWIVRRGVATAYIQMRAIEYKALLQTGLADPGIPTKEVLVVFDLLKEADAQAIFFAVIGDKDVMHRDRIMEALVQRGGPTLGHLLKAGIAHKTPQAAESTRKALERLRADLHAAAAIEVAKVAKDDATMTALVAIAEAAAPEVKTPFLRSLKTSNGALALRILAERARHGDRDAAAGLIEVARTKGAEDQIRALTALKSVATKKDAPAVKALLPRKPSAAHLFAIAEILAQVGDSSLEPRFKEWAHGTEPELRPPAVYFLGRLGGVGALPALHGYLKDGIPGVRREAARALGFIGQGVSVGPLKEAAEEERDADVRFEVVNAMSQIRTKESIEALLFFARERDVRVRRAVTKALAESREPIAGQGLASALNDQDPEVRAMAVRGYILSDPARSVDVWRRALAWLPAGTILAFTREIGQPMLGYIELALLCEREEAREEAIEALRLLPKDEPEMLKKIIATAQDETLKVRLLERLVVLAGDKAAEEVKTLALAGQPRVRVAAIRLLRKLKDKQAAELLEQRLLDPDERVRVAASLTYLSK